MEQTLPSLVFRASIPRYLAARALGKRYPIAALPLSLKRPPKTPAPKGWETVMVRLAGICGSDMALLFGKNSPRLSPFFSFPAVLGHEILGEIEGSRVVVNPVLACREFGQEPCVACARGEDNLCRRVADGPLAPGLLGYNHDLPGGFGPGLVAHPARLVSVPDHVPDERAVLTEPLAVAVHGLGILLKHGMSGKLLIIGVGSIGLLALEAARRLGFSGSMAVVARYSVQAAFAKSRGADQVFGSVEQAAKTVGAHSYRALIGPRAWRGGYDLVIDAAGSRSSLEQAVWAVREGGRVLLLGATGEERHDFSPHWFREVELVGGYTYTEEDFKKSVMLLSEPEGQGLERLVTHRFTIPHYREALAAVVRRVGLKVVLAPG